MLVIKVELWPLGVEEEAQPMGTMTITNDRTGGHGKGNYDIKIYKWEDKGIWKKGRIEDFPRVKLGPWDLLYRALKSVVGYRNENKPKRNYQARK